MKLETLPLKTITNELDFLRKNSYSSMKRLEKKDLLLLANKLIEKISILAVVQNDVFSKFISNILKN